VHGWAVGGGLEWMLGCDLALMAADAGFFFPEIELGLFPTGGTSTLLADRVGLARAKELLLLGERHDAQQALALGLVNRVVAAGELLPEARRLAERVAGLPERARRDVKHVLNRAFRAPIETAMALETEATVAGFLDRDTMERVRQRLD
jgi:enoyl-CoA hydratase/carnithine racemase